MNTKQEPLLIFLGSANVILIAFFEVLSQFHINLTASQQSSISALVTMLVGLYIRSKVTPVDPS